MHLLLVMCVADFSPSFGAAGGRILRVDPHAETTELLGPVLAEDETYEGMAIGVDGCMYFAPVGKAATQVLRYDPVLDASEKVGPDLGHDKWHTGAVGRDGSVFFIPDRCREMTLLRVTPPQPRLDLYEALVRCPEAIRDGLSSRALHGRMLRFISTLAQTPGERPALR